MCSCDQSLVTLAILWEKFSQIHFYKDLTRKTAFFKGWFWFKFNNLGLALGTDLKFYKSLAKGLKLKFRKFWGLIPTFVEVTGEKLVGPTILNRVKVVLRKQPLCGILKIVFRIIDSNSWKIALNEYLRGAWNLVFSGILSWTQHDTTTFPKFLEQLFQNIPFYWHNTSAVVYRFRHILSEKNKPSWIMIRLKLQPR